MTKFKTMLCLAVYAIMCHVVLGDCGCNSNCGYGGRSESSACCNRRGLLVSGKMHSIPDSQITSSTIWSAGHEATGGRLFNEQGYAAWVAGMTDANPWIEFDLGKPWTILAIVTRGRHDADQWVKTYKVKYAASVWDKEAGNWRTLMNMQAPELTPADPTIFTGNLDKTTIQTNWLGDPIKARYIQIYPLTSVNKPKSMRADVIGCFDN